MAMDISLVSTPAHLLLEGRPDISYLVTVSGTIFTAPSTLSNTHPTREEGMSIPLASELLPLVADIVSAFVSNHALAAADLPEMIHSTYTALARLDGAPQETLSTEPHPAVPVNKSVMPEYIICLEDGKKLKMLKRHLSTAYGLTPELYRERWGLPPTYPMIAPNYAKRRSTIAKVSGLGRNAVDSPETPSTEIKIVPEGVSGLKRTSKRAG